MGPSILQSIATSGGRIHDIYIQNHVYIYTVHIYIYTNFHMHITYTYILWRDYDDLAAMSRRE